MKKMFLLLLIFIATSSLFAGDFIIKNGVLLQYEGTGKNIVIPNGIREIGEKAFEGAETLNSVTLPKTLIKIDEDAFTDCINLKKVVFNEGLKEIEENGFFDCPLENVLIPASVEKIGMYAFLGPIKTFNVNENNKNFSSIDGVLLNKNATEILFFPCGKLGKYVIPKSVTKLNEEVFDSAKISEITIHSNIENIPTRAFFACSNLEVVNFEEGVKSISDFAFSNCLNLKSIKLPESLKSIGNYSFEACPLVSLTIPKNVKSIGEFVFKGCNNLENIFVDENNETYSSLEGILLSKNKEKFIAYPIGRKTEIYPIPTCVKEIKNGAFFGANNIKSIIFTDKVEIFGDLCFAYMENLLSVALPNNIQDMGVNDFEGCLSLVKVEFPDNMLLIPSHTFFNCSSLQSINLNKVKIIEDNVFYNCMRLENIDMPNVELVMENAFKFCLSLKEVKFSENLKGLGNYTFTFCQNLNKVYLPKSIKNIGNDIFVECPNVEIHAPKNSIGAKYAKNNKIKLIEE